MLELSQLCAGYRGRPVLRGVSLSVQPGELCALLGENGSGKSTLLRAVCGLLPATYARCALEGRELPRLSPRERARLAAYIPQRCRVEAGLTVLDVVLMGANAHTPLLSGYTAAQREQAHACLAQAGALMHAQRLFGTLSEGQRQLVLLARALMQRPRLFLLDEPDGALDLPRRYRALEALRGALGGGGALVSLHDASLALSRCDRVFILKEGRIACGLDLRTSQEAQVREAMRLLYGEVHVCRAGDGYAVVG